MEAFAGLEYDSFEDLDAKPVYLEDMAKEADLEYTDDEDHAEGEFEKKVHSKGYREADDALFAPDVWNTIPEIKSSHNCYMYALNDLSPRSAESCKASRELIAQGKISVTKKEENKYCKRYFHKPGYYFQNVANGRTETDVWFRDETTCRLMNPMLAADSPNIVWRNSENATLKETDNCPDRHYMAALFIHPRAGFHFYRRDHKCEDKPDQLCWSHKPGILDASTKDASGKKIYSVLQADRNYGELNYSEHCSFFCVPENSHARSHSDSRRHKGKL